MKNELSRSYEILMANSTYKPISNLKVDDTVLYYVQDGHPTTDIITHFIPIKVQATI